jgi:hypothetical protein
LDVSILFFCPASTSQYPHWMLQNLIKYLNIGGKDNGCIANKNIFLFAHDCT